VLNVPSNEVPTYVKGLKSVVLTKDTKITNHGLKDGHAYARQSVLTAGTAVLVDQSGRRAAATTTSSTPPATAPGGGVIVTRCKCGNPLLPPQNPQAPGSSAPEEEPGTGTSTPGSVAPGSTRLDTTTRSTTSSSRSTTTRAATTSGTS
jgi:hypothetical protein